MNGSRSNRKWLIRDGISSLLGGWILGSKAATPTSMMVPAMTTTNVGPVPQAVTPPMTTPPTPALTTDEIKARQAAIRASQASNLELGAPAPPTTRTESKGSITVTGKNNVTAGRDVTVINNKIINHNHFSPTSSGDKNGSVATPPAPTTAPDGTGQTTQQQTWSGPRIVRTLPYWDPTRMAGQVQIQNPYGPGTGYASE